MILVSRHLTDYMDIPNNFIVRINLAWEHNLEQLMQHISFLNNPIFLDIPIDRKKPPNNQWNICSIIQATINEPLIKFLAISNVESAAIIREYRELLSKNNIDERVCIVPKIESIAAIENIEEIVNLLPTIPQRTIMIDHDDLFSDIIKKNKDPGGLYTEYILPSIRKCKRYDVRVLRTIGVAFSDN